MFGIYLLQGSVKVDVPGRPLSFVRGLELGGQVGEDLWGVGGWVEEIIQAIKQKQNTGNPQQRQRRFAALRRHKKTLHYKTRLVQDLGRARPIDGRHAQ